MRSPDTAEQKESPRAIAYAVGIVLLAAVLRFYHLGAEDLWLDEGFSLRDATNLDLVHETRPFFFLLLHYWLKLGGGQNEFLLRLPAAIFGIAGVWMLFLVGRRLVGTSAALLASGFMAVSVLHINHSEEVRWYSLIALLAILSMYSLVKWLDDGRARYAVAYALFGLMSVMTFALSVLVIAAQGLFALSYVKAYRAKSAVLMGTQIGILAAWLPWLYNNMQAAPLYREGVTSIKEQPTLANTIALLGKYFLWKWHDPGSLQFAGAFGFSLLVIAVALYGLRGVRRTDASAVLLWMWLAVPVLGMVVACYTVVNTWTPFYLIYASPAFFLLVAKGVHSIRSRYVAVPLAVTVFAVTLARLGLYYRTPVRPEWRPAVEYIQAREHQGDVIGIYDPGNQYVFRYYYQGRSEFAPVGDVALTGDRLRNWNEDKVEALLSTFPLEGERLWLVLCNHTYAGGFHIINYVRRNYRVLDYRSYNMLEVYLIDASGRPVPVEAARMGKKT